MDAKLPKTVAIRMLQCAAGWRPITPQMARRMLRIFIRLPAYVAAENFVPLDPWQERVLAALGNYQPREAIAEEIDTTVEEVERLLRASAATLCGNLLYWRDEGDGAGDREPRPHPDSHLPSLTATAPLPLSIERITVATVQQLLGQFPRSSAQNSAQ
jgi:hypothetical protein